MEDGYVKLWCMDDPLYLLEPFTKWQAWTDLVLNARHTEGTMITRGIMYKVKRGEVTFSEETMAKRWEWSRGKVRRFLSYLEKDCRITIREAQQEILLKNIITICNYNKAGIFIHNS